MENNNVLVHHGIKGQKWGVRRFQNKDGSLTAAGKKQLQRESDKAKANGQKLVAIDRIGKDGKVISSKYKAYGPTDKDREREANDKKKADMKNASKNRRTLSDADLQKRIERMQNERKLKDLTEEDLSPGRKFCKEVLSSSGRKVATTVLTGAALYAVKASLEGSFNPKEAASYLAPRPKNK